MMGSSLIDVKYAKCKPMGKKIIGLQVATLDQTDVRFFWKYRMNHCRPAHNIFVKVLLQSDEWFRDPSISNKHTNIHLCIDNNQLISIYNFNFSLVSHGFGLDT